MREYSVETSSGIPSRCQTCLNVYKAFKLVLDTHDSLLSTNALFKCWLSLLLLWRSSFPRFRHMVVSFLILGMTSGMMDGTLIIRLLARPPFSALGLLSQFFFGFFHQSINSYSMINKRPYHGCYRFHCCLQWWRYGWCLAVDRHSFCWYCYNRVLESGLASPLRTYGELMKRKNGLGCVM